MSKIDKINIRVPVFVNKKNKQINTYFKNEQLPKEVLDAIKKNPSSIKALKLGYKGVEWHGK